MAWEYVSLGEVISQRKEFIEIKPDETYMRCRVQTSARGVVLRDRVDGATIKTKRQQVCRAGEFLVAEIDAKMGGYGVVPTELEGAIVSSHYFLYHVDETRLLGKFLDWYSKTSKFFEQVKARGSTNYAAIRADAVLEFKIPLPSVEIQTEIVGRLTAAEASVRAALELQQSVSDDRKALLFALINGSKNELHPRIPLGEVAQLQTPDVLVEPNIEYGFAGVYSFGKGVFKGASKLGSEFSYKTLSRIRQDDFIYPKLMAWEGALGVVPKDCDGLFVSPEFPVFSINSNIVYPEVIDAYFKHPSTWPNLDVSSKGTNLRRRRIHPKAIQKHRIPVPPRPIQDVIKALVCSDYDALWEENRVALEALIPAMLHEIFEREANKPGVASATSRPTVVRLPVQQEPVSDNPFKEAVLVGAIVKAFHEDNGQPIGNFRLQKAVYFARRQMGESALDKEYLRKAAGPYNPAMRYSGGIKIATDKNWIKRATGKYGEGNALGEAATEMDEWIERYQLAPAAAWVRDRFKYKSNDLWEALATIDYTMLALDHEDIRPTSAAVLSYIAADDEWRPKIERLRLTEASIQNVMVELESLFIDTGG
ncbi:restriction endonuclease subunit S [Brucella anthropi]|uniref:restriction endonuclease subunit S n=1 Tax=Brucella anthropi TaxID=529 RepID=UPI00384A8A30